MKAFYFLALLLLLNAYVKAQWTDNTSDNLHVADLNASDIHATGIAEGRTWIAYYSQNGNNYDMRAQLLDSTGKKLLGENGVLVCSEPSGSATFEFSVCTNGRYDLIIGFQYEIEGVLNAVVSKIDIEGNLLWGEKGIVLGAGLSPYPAVLSSGKTAVAYNNSVTNTVSLQMINSDGTLAFPGSKDVTVNGGATTRGQVAANLNGAFTLVFQKRGAGIATTLYAQRYNTNGKAEFQTPVLLSDLSTSGARYYSVKSDYDTTYVGYYGSMGSRFNAYLQRIDPDATTPLPYGLNGSAFSAATGANDYYQQTTNIAFKDSSQVIWAVCTYSNTAQTEYGVYVQKYVKTTGQRLLTVRAREVYAVSSLLDTQVGELSVTGEDKPGFITYDAAHHIYATKLDAKGDAELSGKNELLAGSNFEKSRFSFASNDVIGVAVWSENRGLTDMPYAQNISPAGVTGVLPISITQFTAVKKDKMAELSWSTASEINNKGFYIERSANAQAFHSIGFVAAVPGGSLSNAYKFTDKLPLADHNYYRLKQVDVNGKATYSATMMVNFGNLLSLSLQGLYPNPASHSLRLQLQSNSNQKVQVRISNVNGVLLQQQSFETVAGINTLPLNIRQLAAGTYVVEVLAGREHLSLKFSKQ